MDQRWHCCASLLAVYMDSFPPRMIAAHVAHYYRSLVEAYGHYIRAPNSPQLTVISFLDGLNNQDYVSNADFIKVMRAIKECRMEHYERPIIVEVVAVVDTGTDDAVDEIAGVRTERPFYFLLERLKPCSRLLKFLFYFQVIVNFAPGIGVSNYYYLHQHKRAVEIRQNCYYYESSHYQFPFFPFWS